jgi:C1A family cysteine protease
MKKKITVLLVLTVLAVAVIPANGLILQKQEELKNCQICSQEKKSDNSHEYYPIMRESPVFSIFPEKGKPQVLVDTPNNFNWGKFNEKNWLTPVKKQLCGDCWDFAALGTFESIIKIRENCSEFNPDLSEQYVLSCLEGAGSCHGGNSYRAFQRINETTEEGNFCNGVILESCFPYQGSDDISCEEKCDDWKEKLVPILDFGQWKPSKGQKGIDEIKTFILKNGPVVVHIDATRFFKYWGATHNNPDDYFPYTGPKIMINHVVMLVGWKDDPNVRNGGYWICKNSWGADWGYNGFFNIEYDSLNIDNRNIVWVDYDPETYNWKPVANAGINHIVKTDEKIIFDGSKSFDPDSDKIDYYWDFGDGNESKCEVVGHKYQKKGIYNVTLTITDLNGKNDSDKIFVWVDTEPNPPDSPVVKGPDFVLPKKEYTFLISSNDKDNDKIYYLLDWDGYYETEEWIGPFESGAEVKITRSWGFFNKPEIKVKAKDIYGLESEWSNTTFKNTEIEGQLSLKDIFNRLIKMPFLNILLDLRFT